MTKDMVLVPREPTQEMIDAARTLCITRAADFADIYRAMLAAAPQPAADVQRESLCRFVGYLTAAVPQLNPVDVSGMVAHVDAFMAAEQQPAAQPVRVCPSKDAICGPRADRWCADCPNKQPATQPACDPTQTQCKPGGNPDGCDYPACQQPAPVDYPSAYQLYQCTGIGVRQEAKGYNRPPSGEPCSTEDWNAGYAAGLQDGKAAQIDPQEVMRLHHAALQAAIDYGYSGEESEVGRNGAKRMHEYSAALAHAVGAGNG